MEVLTLEEGVGTLESIVMTVPLGAGVEVISPEGVEVEAAADVEGETAEEVALHLPR